MHVDDGFFGQHLAVRDFLQLFEQLPSVIFYAKDTDGRFVAANSAMLATKGMTDAADLLGRRDGDFHPPVLADAYRAEDCEVMTTDAPIINKIWFVLDRHGRPGWFLSNKVPLHGADGAVVGVAGIRYAIDTPADRSRQFRMLAPVIKILETRHREPLSMADLAKIAGMSSTHFNRQFAALLGVSPTDLLHAMRIEHAQQLLVATDRTISDIAIDSGYYDQSHFTRHFRQRCGLTPRTYRQRFRNSR